MIERLTRAARESAGDLTAWRRHLHAYPELKFEEHLTTGWLVERLEEWGIPYSRPTPTGLVATVEGSRSGPCIAVRADLDGLPIEEQNTFPYASRRPGVMHACGHDGHTAVLLGLARFLHRNREFPGKVLLLFQPAEEGGGGARHFVEAGVLEGVSACIGIHFASELSTGTASIRSGPMMASADGFVARIQGRGGHGAGPHQTVDPIVVACSAVMNLQTIVARRINPLRPAVVTIGSIHAGQAGNVIPDSAELRGTVRTLDRETREQVRQEVAHMLDASGYAYGATVSVQFTPGYPLLVNDPAIAAAMAGAAREVLGEERVQTAEPVMASEDFAYYAERVPSAFLFVGCNNPAVGAVWPHHHPRFTIDEAAMPLAMQILGRAALRLLGVEGT